ncbi:MAG: hypothetical protein KME55_41435 [Nostoc indistinguendum CM1-VF10]|jgi:hypothetical protein|nr:hypothetical protein [Nostoc indistinguendum CM1-VF10]
MNLSCKTQVAYLKLDRIIATKLILPLLLTGLFVTCEASYAHSTSSITNNITRNNLIAQNRGSCEQFLSALAIRETGQQTPPYDIENALGFIGKYQFGETLLIELGYYQVENPYNGGGNGVDKNYWRGTWKGKNEINSREEFMQNKNGVQETAIKEAFSLNSNRISQILQENGRSIEQFIGQELQGAKITQSGILAAAHLRGETGVTNLLLKNEVSNDEFGTSILDYLKEFADYESCI